MLDKLISSRRSLRHRRQLLDLTYSLDIKSSSSSHNRMDLSALYAYQARSSSSSTAFKPPSSISPQNMSHTAFFYGTLMAPQVLHRVIWGSQQSPTPAHASLLTVRPAILHAHQRHKVKHADYPAILPTEAQRQSSVRGTLVQGLTDGDIWRLDIFEGSEYQRREVKVHVLQQTPSAQDQGMGDLQQREQDNIEGEEVEAETYIWIAGSHRLEPEEWDFSEFVRDKMKRWVGKEAAETDEGFQGRPSINDVDDAVAALEDPTGGRGANGHITRELDNGGSVDKEVLQSAV